MTGDVIHQLPDRDSRLDVREPEPTPAASRFGRRARSVPDARLVARLRAGDECAFETIYDRYHRPLLAFCRHMLGSREEAEDALQHVFVSAHRHLASRADLVVDLRPWLYAIARNRCLSILRGRREALALDDLPEPAGEGLAVAAEVEQRQDLQDVLGDLARLPDDQRAALVLSELGALSHEEVAGVLGVRRDKVKALVFQARESLAGWRQARDTDCHEIREQLANLRGGALRRGPLRKHLDTCEGCRSFRSEVRRQREALALLLPVIPSVALKAKVVGAVAVSGGAIPAAGVGIATGVALPASGAGAGVAASGGSAAALGGGLTAKALVVAAVAGTAGGGYAVVDRSTTAKPSAPPPARVASPTPAPAKPALPGAVLPAAAPVSSSPVAVERRGAPQHKSAKPGPPGRERGNGPPATGTRGPAAPAASVTPAAKDGAPGRSEAKAPKSSGQKAKAKGNGKTAPAKGPAAPAQQRPAKPDKAKAKPVLPVQAAPTTEPGASRSDAAQPPRGKSAREAASPEA